MAIKSGLDFFPLDVCLDRKFELIEAEYGLTGFGVIVHLLQEIYGKEGYYIEWTEEVALLFARRIGLGGSVVSEIIEASIRRGMFDQQIYDKYHVLTSRGIQKRYFEAVSRRKNLEIDYNILLVDCAQICPNANISGKNVNIFSKNADIRKQSRVEESRVEESRVKGNVEPPCASTAPAQIGYGEIQAMYNELCPSLPKCQALSEARKKAIKARLSSGYTPEDFRRLFERAEASGFLKGRNDRNWTANFDWLLKDANMAKVLDGNYDDHGMGYGRRGNAVQAKPSGQRELDEAEREAIRRLMEENA